MDAPAAALRNAPHVAPRRRRLALPLAVLIFSLLLLQTARVLNSATRVQSDLQSIQSLTRDGSLTLLQPDHSGELDSLLARSGQDLRDLYATIGPLVYLAPLLGWMPRYGGDLASAPALLDLGEQALKGAQETLKIGESLDAALAAGRAAGTPVGEAILQGVQGQSAAVRQAQSDVAVTAQLRSRVRASALSPTVRDGLARFDQLLPQWQTALDGLSLAPLLLGADRPRVYLLLLQNSDELRPTGGFISSAALLHVDRGQFTVGDFQDSFAVDDLSKVHPFPPAALFQYMEAEQWLFRDSNWSPDLPTTARAAEGLYRLDRGVVVDGVIAVNLGMLPPFLEALGPLELPSYSENVDASNVVSKIESYWSSPQGQGETGDWWTHRKDFIGNLLEAMIQRLRAGEFNNVAFSRALLDSIAAKDLLVYINDLDHESPANALSGALYRGGGDALMIVDSNVGFNKVDGNIERRVQYGVSLSPGGTAVAELDLTYTNLSPVTPEFCVHAARYAATYAELQQGCYWDYLRVIAPASSQLLTATAELNASTDRSMPGRTVFSGYFFLGRGETKTFHFQYRLPFILSGSSYSLRLEKQPGVSARPVTVRISAPEGWGVASTNPGAGRFFGNEVQFDTTLDRDQLLQVTFDSPPSAVVIFAVLLVVGGSILIAVRLNRHGSARWLSAADKAKA